MEHAEAIGMGAAEKYLLDELNEEERAGFEEHFFGCPECAEDVKSAAALADGARRVLSERTAAASRPVEPRKRWLSLVWPMPWATAAALALLVGVTGYQARELAGARAPQPAFWHFLSVSRSAPQVVALPKGVGMLGLTLSKTPKSYPYYRCEIRGPRGRTTTSFVVPGPPPGDELQVVIPVSRLETGSYELVLAGLQSPSGPVAEAELARYPFSVRTREE